MTFAQYCNASKYQMIFGDSEDIMRLFLIFNFLKKGVVQFLKQKT